MTDGVPTVTVWPAHVALATSPDEYVPHDRRAQIVWQNDGSQIVGHAAPLTTRGDYRFVQYFRHPAEPPYMVGQLDQPYRHETDGPKNVGPITVMGDHVIAHV